MTERFIQGEERCLKFINQDLTFLQESHIPSTFTNVSHTTTYLKEPVCINLPTCTPNEHSLKENIVSSCTQSVQPALGFTPAKVCHAESNPTLTVPQLLEIEPFREYTETPLKTLDGLYVTQPKRFLPLAQEAKKLAKELCKEEIASQWAGLPPEKLLQESFLEQLEALQALDQLAHLQPQKNIYQVILLIYCHISEKWIISLSISYTVLRRIVQTDTTQRLYRRLHNS